MEPTRLFATERPVGLESPGGRFCSLYSRVVAQDEADRDGERNHAATVDSCQREVLPSRTLLSLLRTTLKEIQATTLSFVKMVLSRITRSFLTSAA